MVKRICIVLVALLAAIGLMDAGCSMDGTASTSGVPTRFTASRAVVEN